MKYIIIICLGLLLSGCYMYSGSYYRGNSTLDRWQYEDQIRYENHQRNQILHNQRRAEQIQRQQNIPNLLK